MLKVSLLLTIIVVFSASLFARTSTRVRSKKNGPVAESPRARKRVARLHHSRRTLRNANLRVRRHRYYEHFTANSFAENVAEGDNTVGEDPIVRQAALDALGNMNGTVVAIDPTSGRILAMVNQKLALSEGAPPCSTIKVPVAPTALRANRLAPDTA